MMRITKNIEGMEEFHNGQASSISGLEKIDKYSVKNSL